jgi:hypothetical protein
MLRDTLESVQRARPQIRTNSHPTMQPTIAVSTLKITIPLRAHQVPKDLVPPEPAPTGNPILLIELQGCSTPIPAQLSGKNARKTLKALAGQPEDTPLVLNGNLAPGLKSGTWQITGASFQVFSKPTTTDPNPESGSAPPNQSGSGLQSKSGSSSPS